MKKKSLIFLLGLTAAITLSACSSNDSTDKSADAQKQTVAADTELTMADADDEADEASDDADGANGDADDADGSDADDDAAADDTDGDDTDGNAADEDDNTSAEDSDAGQDADADAKLEPITPSDYLISDPDQYITVGTLEGLEATQYTYEITDDMVQERIQNDLDAYSEEQEVDRASQAGDIVLADVTSTVQGDADSTYTESTYYVIGEEENGPEFDAQLTGVVAGDKKSFSIAFGEETMMDEWINQTVDFEIEVTGVEEILTPEFNDEFVSENTDYASTEEYETATRETLEIEYQDISYSDATESLLQAALDDSVISSYPDELYDSCKTEVLSFYAAFAGTTNEDEIYDMFGITAEDIEPDVLDSVYRRLLISAVSAKNNIEVTEDEYVSYLEQYAPEYGYDSPVDFETDYTRETLVWSLYESKVLDYLYQSAKITETPYDASLAADEELTDAEDSEDGADAADAEDDTENGADAADAEDEAEDGADAADTEEDAEDGADAADVEDNAEDGADA